MAVNLTELGESVYTQHPIEARRASAVYSTVEGILSREGVCGPILDVAASDGVANFGSSLADFVVGVDLADNAVRANHTELTAQADVRALPFAAGVFTHVLALDIIEHFPPIEAVAVLREMHRVGTAEHRAIVSMPVISPSRVATWSAYREYLKLGQRPEMGLLDRTHKILRGPRYHRRLFNRAGYEVVDEYETLVHTKGSRHLRGPHHTPYEVHPQATDIGGRLRNSYALVQAADHPLAKPLGHILGFQRISVLKPRD